MKDLVKWLHKNKGGMLFEIAAELDTTVSSVAADAGGLHDRGYATKYGNGAESLVVWDVPEGKENAYILWCLDRGEYPSA